MANYYASARSNYFKVKHATAFIEWVSSVPGLGYWEKDGMFAVYSDCPDSGGWPAYMWDEELNDYVDTDIFETIGGHLTDDSIAVFMEAGAEKLRYINGYAIAVNSKGETITVSLMDIYQLAETTWGMQPTDCSY